MAEYGRPRKPPGAEMRYLSAEDNTQGTQSDTEQRSPMIGPYTEYSDRV